MNATVLEFLTAVYGSTEGVAHLAVGVGGYFTDTDRYAHKGWNQSVFRWPDEADSLARAIGQESAAGHDVYVCPYLTHGRQRAKGTAVERTKVHADLDGDAVPLDLLDDLDAYAVDSGTPGHAHVYVALDESVPAHWHEMLCRGLGRLLGDADAKIADNDVLRPVGTFSQKNTARGGEPTPVQWLRKPTGRRWAPEDLAARLGVTLPHRHAPTTVSGPVTGPAAVVENVDPATLPDRVRDALAEVTGDRSADTMRLVGACHDAGLTLAQARGVIALRTDLAARLAERRDDDVLTCWLKATDSRAERRAGTQWLAGLPHAPTTQVSGTGQVADEEDDAALLAGLRSGEWLDAQVFPPLVWAVHGLIPEGFGLLTGAPKAGKSWCALGIALAVSSGTRALGVVETGTPRPVLLLALEDGDRRLQGRCRALLGDHVPIPALLDYETNTKPADVLKVIAAWLRRHGHARPLVVLDTLGKVMPPAAPGEGTYQRDYRIGSALKRLADAHPGSTLLVVHHVRKAPAEADWMDSTSGTNGLNGAADWTVNLHRPRNEDTGTLRVTGRDVAEGEYAVTSDAGRWTIDGHALADAAHKAAQRRITAGVGDRSAEIVEYVGKQPKPVSAKDVADALDLPDARRYLARLADAGRLTKPSRGMYAPVPLSQVSQCPNGDAPESHPVSQVRQQWDNGTVGTQGQTPLDLSQSLDDRPVCSTCSRPMGRADTPHGVCIQCRRIADASTKAKAAS